MCEINEDRPDAPRREEQSPSQSFQLGSLPLETHSDVFYGSYENVHWKYTLMFSMEELDPV